MQFQHLVRSFILICAVMIETNYDAGSEVVNWNFHNFKTYQHDSLVEVNTDLILDIYINHWKRSYITLSNLTDESSSF